TASLRFYGWREATLSLGYFQAQSVRLTDPRLAALPYVRRPSGGAALVHHHEVTYALALPPGRPWHGEEPWNQRMHSILVEALADLGVRAQLHALEAREQGAGPLCFLLHSPGDLMLGPSKIVGSAQRRQQGAFLQHGAILLKQSPYTPALAGIQ